MGKLSTMQKRRRFIELRARGVSYRKIAAEINVATSTLVRWSQVFAVDIKNLEKIERELFEHEYLLDRKHRMKVYATQLNNIAQELMARDLKDVPTPRLFDLQKQLNGEMQEQCPKLPFGKEFPRGCEEHINLELTKLYTWED